MSSSFVQFEASCLVNLLNLRVSLEIPEVFSLYQEGQMSVLPFMVKVWIPAGLAGSLPSVHFPSGP